MADEVVDTGKIDPSARKGESHRKTCSLVQVGSNAESKKESGQQRCWEQVCEARTEFPKNAKGPVESPFNPLMQSNEPHVSTSPGYTKA